MTIPSWQYKSTVCSSGDDLYNDSSLDRPLQVGNEAPEEFIPGRSIIIQTPVDECFFREVKERSWVAVHKTTY